MLLSDLASDELRNLATVLAAFIALIVFVFNSRVQLRNQRIENISRFFQVHSRIMQLDGFLMTNLRAIEEGGVRRDTEDERMESRFHLLLLQIEQLAILANNKAVPRSTQVYMFGLYARPLLTALTPRERGSMFWDLAVTYLEGLAELTEEYERLSPSERRRFQR
jgi:hypothetical protein